MEINESTKHNSQQYSVAKFDGYVWEGCERIDKTSTSSNNLTLLRTRGGGRRGGRINERRESVSDLEAEETKDLGLVFVEEDLNSELPEILPGLRTFLCREEQRKTESSVPRSYLSEAWEVHSDNWSGRTEKDLMVIDLRMAKLCGEKNMKDSLKWWARFVASNLK